MNEYKKVKITKNKTKPTANWNIFVWQKKEKKKEKKKKKNIYKL